MDFYFNLVKGADYVLVQYVSCCGTHWLVLYNEVLSNIDLLKQHCKSLLWRRGNGSDSLNV